jgi:hypothetical protein
VRAALFKTEAAATEANGAGGQLETGDRDLRMLPDGQMVYALMLDHAIATSYVATDCPPDALLPPIPSTCPRIWTRAGPGLRRRARVHCPPTSTTRCRARPRSSPALIDANTAALVLI